MPNMDIYKYKSLLWHNIAKFIDHLNSFSLVNANKEKECLQNS